MTSGAEFSECGKYRYVLWRAWDDTKPIAMCIGLNPSTANAEKSDPTIRELIKRLAHLGYGGFKMTNLYALVSSKPKALSEVPDALKDNDHWLNKTALECKDVIFCWGIFKQAQHRADMMKVRFPFAKCFGRAKDGSPIHPLALMYGGVKVSETKLDFYNSYWKL